MRYSGKEKIEICKLCIIKKESIRTIAYENNIREDTLKDWLRRYKVYGNKAFIRETKHRIFSKSFKNEVCKDYLSDKTNSKRSIALKYNIDTSVLRSWLKKYMI